MKKKPLHPLISCICITEKRPEMLLKSILSFDQQNYPNTELVISYPHDDQETKNVITEVLAVIQIRILAIEHKNGISIGVARNNAVKACHGEYVCNWDDDDFYFYSRIADQYNLMRGNGKYFQSSMITQIILFDAISSKAYLSFPHLWNGSLLCKKSHFLLHPCTDTDTAECQPVISYLASNKLILQTDLGPMLYTYVYHGQNKTDYHHFQYLLRKSTPLEDQFSQDLQNYFEQQIKINV